MPSTQCHLAPCRLAGVLAAAVWLFAGPLDACQEHRSQPLEWGLYQILWSPAYGRQLDRELAKFASKPQYVMFFRDLDRPFPKFAVDCIRRRGATPIVSLELWRWHGDHQGSYLPLIQAGAYDDFLRAWAHDAEADHRRVLLRFGFEFNGNWNRWSGDPEGFVAAWRHAHDIFRDAGARHVEWVWAPNVVSVPNTAKNDMHRYYPGDAYVDWIGVDGYNFGANHDQWHRWQSFEEIFSNVLARFQERYGDKPVMITEFGCAPGRPGQREQWIRAAYESLLRRPQVKAAVWFHYDKRGEAEPDWRIDVSPASLRAFNETFARARSEHGREAPDDR